MCSDPITALLTYTRTCRQGLLKAAIAVDREPVHGRWFNRGACNDVSLSIIKASISIGKVENIIRKSINQYDLSGGGIDRNESAIDRGNNIADLSINSVTYKQIHSVVACIG